MIWEYLRSKLKIDEQEEKISEHEQEINKIRNHVIDIKKKPRKKIIRKIERKDERVDKLKKRIDAFYEWGLKMHEAVDNNRKALGKLSEFLMDGEIFPDEAQGPDRVGGNLESEFYNQRKFEGRRRIGNSTPRESEEFVHSSQVNQADSREGRPTDAEQTANNIKVGRELWEKATDAQKRIIKKMYDLGYPVSYKELASELGNSVSTIKSHINSLKDKNYKFKISLGPNSTKKYMLDESIKSYLTNRLND